MDSIRDRAIAADESGDLPLAFELWGKLAETDTDGIASLKYGVAAIQLEKWDVAEAALYATLRLRPTSSLAMCFMGRLWMGRADLGEADSLQAAKQWYLKSLERKRIAPTLSLLGAVCKALDQNPEAKAAFEEAIAIDPNYEEAMYNLAVLEEKNDPQRCVSLLKRAVEIDPAYSIAHQLLGRALQKQGDRILAEVHFRRCLEMDPDDCWSGLYLANILAVLGKNEEAEQTYRHAVELEPELEGGFRFFANFLASIGKVAEATEVRSRVPRLPPNTDVPPARAGL